jgi:hypothetical protein
MALGRIRGFNFIPPPVDAAMTVVEDRRLAAVETGVVPFSEPLTCPFPLETLNPLVTVVDFP